MNTLQVLAGQVLGVFIFLLLSRYLDKDSYGQLNWALAVLTTATAVLSMRLEQVVVRDVAAGRNASSLAGLFLLHTIGASAVLLLLLLVFRAQPLLWWLSFSQLLLMMALPFRQVVTGRSAFGWLVVVGSVSNLVRCVGVFGLVVFSAVSLRTVVVLFTVSAVVEWVVGYWVVVYRLEVPVRWGRWNEYRQLIVDSLPQLGMVVLTSGMARVDWILMGLFSGSAATAEYSFAYRAYEFSPLPLLVLAPLLLNDLSRGDRTRLPWFRRVYLIAGILLPLAGILIWSPMMGWLTEGKYGRSDWWIFAVLSCSVPFQYFVNLYWTEEFAANRLGRILGITAVTALFVVVGDLVAIPEWGGVGAAVVWTGGMILQWAGYRWGRNLLSIDWFLLVFLVLMVNVKLYIKIVAILMLLIVYGKRLISKEVFRQRYIVFYIGMLSLAVVNLLFSFQSLSLPAVFAFGMGACYWLLALLAAVIIYWFVQQMEPRRLHRTLEVFFC
ncbi:oligosaccharide flippase family protein [Puia sp. P3]|uniref:oligosaccharide flippase family protein n=1 Tax=Puia sp. P3 TaxID=3423952 RepID=UPI003D671310